ncbi:hypothetical protein BX600DRAFT_432209 [Xylariales sp. PMI_506]|nr:hypothetical protein BX600DRAFT_432209 [Xylariales sp. PMI_506]
MACPSVDIVNSATVATSSHIDTREPYHLDESLGVPPGFPAALNHPLAWNGAQYKDKESQYCFCLSERHLEEIHVALEHFNDLELDGDAVQRENFPLPSLGPELLRIGEDVYNGKGFALIRGINPDDFGVGDLSTIWLGIQAYIGDQRGRQDHKGNMLVHIVADSSSGIKAGHHRHSTSAIVRDYLEFSFHNEESGDIVAWLTRNTAASGGRCVISSAYNIYNTLATHRPDVIRTLSKGDWPFAFPRFQCRPIFYYEDSKLIMNFGRTPLTGNAVHPRPDHLPKVTDKQLEALNLVESIAHAGELEIQTQPGDMHFINNLAVLHRRNSYVNGAGEHGKRHLVRMRLRSSHLGWTIPVDLKKEWDDAFEGQSPKTWHIEPMPGDAFPLRKYTN